MGSLHMQGEIMGAKNWGTTLLSISTFKVSFPTGLLIIHLEIDGVL
jgi:hypothetical protein